MELPPYDQDALFAQISPKLDIEYHVTLVTTSEVQVSVNLSNRDFGKKIKNLSQHSYDICLRVKYTTEIGTLVFEINSSESATI